MQLRTTAQLASCLLAVVLLSHGVAASVLKRHTAFGRSQTSKKKFTARALEGSDCDVGFFYAASAHPSVYGTYPPPPSSYPPSYPPPSYPPSYPPSPPSYPTSYPPPPVSGCTPCPAGSSTPAGASSIDECTACIAGYTSSGAGGACEPISIPPVDLSKQRDVRFEFFGPDFSSLQAETQAYRDSFNSTITSRMAAAITSEGIWVYLWRSGSIVTDNRVTFAEGTSVGEMDDAMNYMLENAAAVFGDLSAFGVTGVRGQAMAEDDDGNNDGGSRALDIGLGVGLGLGIPLLACISYFIWKKRRDDQTVAPNPSSSAKV